MKALKSFLILFAAVFMAFLSVDAFAAFVPAAGVDTLFEKSITTLSITAVSCFIPGMQGVLFTGASVPNFGALISNIADPRSFRNAVVAYLDFMNAPIDNLPKTLGDYTAWHAKSFVNTNNSIEFFNGAYVESNTNMREGFTRAQNEHMIITGIEFFSSADVAGSFGNIDIDPGVDNAFLKDAKLTITVNGVIQLKGIPMSDFNRVAEEKNSGLLQLAVPIVWQGQTNISVRVDFGAAVSGLTNAIWVQCKLRGIGLFS